MGNKIGSIVLLAGVSLVLLSRGTTAASTCPEGMISYWKFDEGSGNVAGDSYNGNPGMLVNNPIWTSGRVGDALDFDGVDDYMDYGTTASFNWGVGSSFTYSFWLQTIENQGALISQRHGANPSAVVDIAIGYAGFSNFGSGEVGVLFRDDTGSTSGCFSGCIEVDSDTVVNDGNFHHIAVVRDAAEGRVKIYIDGVLKTNIVDDGLTAGITTNLRAIASERFWVVGNWGTPDRQFFDGLIDEVAIYNRTLSDGEILRHYLNGLQGRDYCYEHWSVPYIHQCFDTPKDFCGSEACGAASAVMLLAGMNRIVPWPNNHMDTCCESGCAQQGDHANDYGNYVSKEYMCAGTTWDEQTYDLNNKHLAKGAYGYIHHNEKHGAERDRIQYYLWAHGLRGPYGVDTVDPMGNPVHIPDAPDVKYWPYFTQQDIKDVLVSNYPVIMNTNLTDDLGGSAHIVLITGYDSESDCFIVNDPFGEHPYNGDYTCGSYDGNHVRYNWEDFDINDGNKYIVYPTEYVNLDNNPPPEPTGSNQFRSDGNTPIPFGKLITLPVVVFKGFVEDNSAPVEARDSVRLEIELKHICQQFTGVPTHFSNFSPNWSEIERSITLSGLRSGQYHWRARTVDIRGKASQWVSAGNNPESEPDFSVGIAFLLCSPADMIITDPEGLTISKEINQIPGATYEEIDVDGATHDRASIPGQKIGNYSVAVIPDHNASPTDTYSLTLEVGGMTATLADNVQIQDIPAEGYEFESKLNRSDFDTDGDVDVVDLDTFVLHWLAEDCNYPSWCEGTDLNYNGRADFIDFAIFADNWLWEKIIADLDIDGNVNFVDYAILANQWLQPPGFPSADIAPEVPDGVVNILDLAVLVEHWLEGVTP